MACPFSGRSSTHSPRSSVSEGFAAGRGTGRLRYALPLVLVSVILRLSNSNSPVKVDSRAGSRSPASRAASVNFFSEDYPRLSPGFFFAPNSLSSPRCPTRLWREVGNGRLRIMLS